MAAKLLSTRHWIVIFSITTSLIFSTQKTNACNAVTGLTTSSITSSGAKFKWTSVSCDSFLVRYYNTAYPNTIYYKTVSSGTATSVTVSGTLSKFNLQLAYTYVLQWWAIRALSIYCIYFYHFKLYCILYRSKSNLHLKRNCKFCGA